MDYYPIDTQLPFSGKRPYPAGLYFTENREPTGNAWIPGFGPTNDGSAAQEPNVLPGAGIRRFVEHAGVIRSAARVIQITVKKFGNKWHEHYDPGLAAFILINVTPFSISRAETPQVSVIYPSHSASILLTPPQLSSVMYDAERRRQEAYSSEKLDLESKSYDGSTADAKKHPFATMERLRMKEVEWSDSKGDGVLKIEGDKTYNEKKDAVIAAYAKVPNLGFCNGYFLAEHVRFFGIIESTMDTGEPNRMDVSVAVSGGSHTMNYWGPFLESLDRVGFYVTKKDDTKYKPSDTNPFVLKAWRNPMAFMPGLGLADPGKYDSDELKEGRIVSKSDWPTYVSSDGETHLAPSYNAGFINRRERIDYSDIAVAGAAETYAKHCEQLLGLAEGFEPNDPIDPVYSACLSQNIARLVYLHVCIAV